MCGITGIWTLASSGINPMPALSAMHKAQQHRGPDGEGLFVHHQSGTELQHQELNWSCSAGPGLAISHQRLAIIDLSEHGAQPMRDQQSGSLLFYNGEIYNYLELREKMQKSGISFETNSDTEVLLKGLARDGIHFLNQVWGMFAFAWYNPANEELILARDRNGVKPLYYTFQQQTFAFASEFKALYQVPFFNWHLNHTALINYLAQGLAQEADHPWLKELEELVPGHYLKLSIQEGQFNTTHAPWLSPEHISNAEKTTFEDCLRESVRMHLRSDVPVGVCLSGGLDSGALLKLIQEERPEADAFIPFAFTAEFPGFEYDELKWASQLTGQLDVIHRTVAPTQASFIKDWQKWVYVQDFPMGSASPYAQYKVMELAAQSPVKVLLDGQGADELLGGYAHHQLAYAWELMKEGAWGKAFGLLTAGMRGVNFRAFGREWFKATILPETFKEILVRYNPVLKHCRPEWQNLVRPSTALLLQGGLKEQLQHDFWGPRLQHLLRLEDRNAMYFGLESRVPYTDFPPLINKVAALKSEALIQRSYTKAPLRKWAKGKLPERYQQEKAKVAFEVPQAAWNEALLDMLEGPLKERHERYATLLMGKVPARKEWKAWNQKAPLQVWRWLNLLAWHEQFPAVQV